MGGRPAGRVRTRAAAVLLLVVVALWGAVPGASAAGAGADADLGPYQGSGAWVDIYDEPAMSHPERFVASIAAAGAQTIYVETGNYRQPPGVAIVRPRTIGRFLDAAHRAGLGTVAWYLPGLVNRRRDLGRALAAIRLRSRGGVGFDSFALDIESTLIGSIPRRNAALFALSRRLRRAVGPGYALGAIVPDERSSVARGFWPDFPARSLTSLYDVFLPMAYSTLRGRGADYVYRYTRENVAFLRRRTGDPVLPVHLIAGLADGLDGASARAALRGARDEGAIGASLYEGALLGPEDLSALGAFRG